MSKSEQTKSAQADPQVRALIPTGVVNDYGEVYEGGGFNLQCGDQDADYVYVPGFSDLRWQQDKAKSEVAAGLRHPKDVPALPVNMRWTRRTTKQGTPDGTKMIGAGRKGYRAVTKDDLPGADGVPKHAWLTALPPGSQILADGTLASADMTLMVCDGPTAARNAYAKTQRTAAQLGQAQGVANTAGVSYQSERMAPLEGVPASSIKVR